MSGDSGKTLVSLAIVLGARDRGWLVRGFKKGPDYIDAAWLTWASGTPARNLDTYFAGPDGVRRAFARHAVRRASDTAAAVNVIEGNRGLFDGMDAEGTHSTAVLAKLIGAPVVLVLNARKMTGTAAALVRGCQALDPDLRISGVILNRVAGRRHETVAREAIDRACGLPVLGAIPRLDEPDLLPGRHLGLVTPHEHVALERLIGVLRRIAREHLDLDRILATAGAPPVADDDLPLFGDAGVSTVSARPVTIGYLSDSAFNFYYPDNLEALEALGATLAPLSSLSGEPLPPGIDALYVGGGFPETHAAALEGNRALLDSLRTSAARGLPIYAECGGLMLLANTVTWQGGRHTMAGVLPVDVEVLAAPQGHGYVALSVDRPNPFFAVGQGIRAHEFHYSRICGDLPDTACAVLRGTGCGGGRDAIVADNVWASYAHVHAGGLPEWAQGLVRAARAHREAKSEN
jgi:cobyrinic acid a,c-diamide synthase